VKLSIAILPTFVIGAVACGHAQAHSPHGTDHHDHAVSEAGADHPNKLVRAGEGETVANPFHPIHLLLSNTENAGAVTVYEFDLPPMSPGSPPHTHSLEDEYFFVVSGTLDVMFDGEVRRLEPGDFAALTRGHTHMFWNGSDAPSKVLMATTGASFEAFMASAAPRLAGAQPGSAEEAGAVLGQLAAEHGITIRMDKMPEAAAPLYMPPSPAE
jgi:uncharacterized cupin superfamily protein